MPADSGKYILIAGLPRSGSTLLQAILNKSDSTYTLPETHFFEEAKKINPSMVFGIAEVETLFHILSSKWSFSFALFSQITRQFPNQDLLDIREIYFKIIDAYKPNEQENKLIAIEKTPGNLIAIRSLLEFDPTLKCVLTCRNPRDFVNSISKTHWSPSSIDKILLDWKSSLSMIFELAKDFPSNIRILHYEDMVDTPDYTFGQVYDFINLKWDKKNLYKINDNVKSFVLPAEYKWKENNLKLNTVTNKPSDFVLSFQQRCKIFIHTFIPIVKFRYLKYSRF